MNAFSLERLSSSQLGFLSDFVWVLLVSPCTELLFLGKSSAGALSSQLLAWAALVWFMACSAKFRSICFRFRIFIYTLVLVYLALDNIMVVFRGILLQPVPLFLAVRARFPCMGSLLRELEMALFVLLFELCLLII